MLAPSRHASQASCHRQDYPITRPSPGVNHPIYPSFPALVSRSLPKVRIPKSHERFFLFHTHTSHSQTSRLLTSLTLVSICRCTGPPINPVFTRSLDPSVLVFSLSLHRYLYTCILCSTHIIHYKKHKNKHYNSSPPCCQTETQCVWFLSCSISTQMEKDSLSPSWESFL